MKIPGPFLVFRNTEKIRLYREIIETDWNMKKINVSVVSKRFETRLWKRWKYRGPFLVLFQNVLRQNWNKVKIPGPISVVCCSDTLRPLYNTIVAVGVQASFRFSYPMHVIPRVKCINYIRKGVLNSQLGSKPDPCYIQKRVITNRVIKRFRCSCMHRFYFSLLFQLSFRCAL